MLLLFFILFFIYLFLPLFKKNESNNVFLNIDQKATLVKVFGTTDCVWFG